MNKNDTNKEIDRLLSSQILLNESSFKGLRDGICQGLTDFPIVKDIVRKIDILDSKEIMLLNQNNPGFNSSSFLMLTRPIHEITGFCDIYLNPNISEMIAPEFGTLQQVANMTTDIYHELIHASQHAFVYKKNPEDYKEAWNCDKDYFISYYRSTIPYHMYDFTHYLVNKYEWKFEDLDVFLSGYPARYCSNAQLYVEIIPLILGWRLFLPNFIDRLKSSEAGIVKLADRFELTIPILEKSLCIANTVFSEYAEYVNDASLNINEITNMNTNTSFLKNGNTQLATSY